MFLATLSTAYARFASQSDVTVFYKGGWVHRVGGYSFPDGDQFVFGRRSAKGWIAERNLWFENARRFWYRLYSPKAGDVIVDVGAGRGEDTLPFSQAVGATGKVIAIEAQPSSFDRLCRLCELNRLDNVAPLQLAVSDSPGVLFAERSPAGWQWDVVVEIPDPSGDYEQVTSVTLDNVCSELALGRIDFLKMNIEGAERQALAGATSLASKTRFMCICCHDFRADNGEGDSFRTRQFVENWLTTNGFTIYRLPHEYVWERDHVHAVNRAIL